MESDLSPASSPSAEGPTADASDPSEAIQSPEGEILHEGEVPHSPLTWLGRNRRLARWVGHPILRFAEIEAAGGIALLAATVVALVWANSPWEHLYHDLLEAHITVDLGGLLHLDEPLEAWVNDALMTVFFFVVGLEIKREFVVGELRKPAAAVFPAVAALGGMIVPALIYTAFNAGGYGSAGWGIPMATDIAFAVGIVSLLGRRVPSTLKIFLLTLAIVDDIGAIIVIAVFYTDDLSTGWLMLAAVTFAVLVGMRAARIWYTPAYLPVGLFLWLSVLESGVHATIAGVILGLMTPAMPLISKDSDDAIAEGEAARITPGIFPGIADGMTAGDMSVPLMRRAYFEVREHVSVAVRLQNLLHPWTSFIVVPVFAFANAGVSLSWDSAEDAIRSPVTLGVVAGLVVGKLVGVSLFSWLGVRSGLFSLPRGVTWPKMFGISAVAGIGFTVSLFIAKLAFKTGEAVPEAKIGILAASLVAAIIGVTILASSESDGEAATQAA